MLLAGRIRRQDLQAGSAGRIGKQGEQSKQGEQGEQGVTGEASQGVASESQASTRTI